MTPHTLQTEFTRVKPLAWEDFEGIGAKASAYYQANYLIQFWKGREQFEVALSYPGYQTGYDGERWHPTLEAAKAAAQADYTARILAALELVPERDDARALLVICLPYIEDCAGDPAYKGAPVADLVRRIRAEVAR